MLEGIHWIFRTMKIPFLQVRLAVEIPNERGPLARLTSYKYPDATLRDLDKIERELLKQPWLVANVQLASRAESDF